MPAARAAATLACRAHRLLVRASGAAKLSVLLALDAGGPLTAALLAAELGGHRRTLDNLLCRMVAAGLLLSEPVPGAPHKLMRYRLNRGHPAVALALAALREARDGG
jgi:hypothetical protein